MVDSSPIKVRNLNLSFTPVPLPQDKLAVPSFPLFDKNSGREHVDRYNREITKQEFYSYTGSFLALPSAGTSQTLVLPTDPDGDFWMSTLVLDVLLSGTNNSVQVPGYIQLTNARTGNNLFDAQGGGSGLPFPSGAQISMFRGREPANALTLAKNPIIQPFCFTRDGAIRVNVVLPTKPGGANTYDLWFALLGWKEYANAAGVR